MENLLSSPHLAPPSSLFTLYLCTKPFAFICSARPLLLLLDVLHTSISPHTAWAKNKNWGESTFPPPPPPTPRKVFFFSGRGYPTTHTLQARTKKTFFSFSLSREGVGFRVMAIPLFGQRIASQMRAVARPNMEPNHFFFFRGKEFFLSSPPLEFDERQNEVSAKKGGERIVERVVRWETVECVTVERKTRPNT